MESVWNYYYSITKRMLSLAGQWPYQNRKERLLRMILVTMTEFSVIVPQVDASTYEFSISNCENKIKKLFD